MNKLLVLDDQMSYVLFNDRNYGWESNRKKYFSFKLSVFYGLCQNMNPFQYIQLNDTTINSINLDKKRNFGQNKRQKCPNIDNTVELEEELYYNNKLNQLYLWWIFTLNNVFIDVTTDIFVYTNHRLIYNERIFHTEKSNKTQAIYMWNSFTI